MPSPTNNGHRAIGRFSDRNQRNFCLLQIVYVAPMKALAAEMTRNFGGRLESLGIKVRELTGDMQLTKSEIAETQVSDNRVFENLRKAAAMLEKSGARFSQIFVGQNCRVGEKTVVHRIRLNLQRVVVKL